VGDSNTRAKPLSVLPAFLFPVPVLSVTPVDGNVSSWKRLSHVFGFGLVFIFGFGLGPKSSSVTATRDDKIAPCSAWNYNLTALHHLLLFLIMMSCCNVWCEQLMRSMSSTDTPLNTVHLLQEKQRADKQPYIVLSGGKGIAAYVYTSSMYSSCEHCVSFR